MSHVPFQTLQHSVSISGVGLHTGSPVRVTLHPRQEVGLVFVRNDIPDAPPLTPSLASVARTTHATTLEQEGVSISTTEHLLAALWASGVTHCVIELDGPEVPILDGSAGDWCRLIREAGLAPTTGAQEDRPVWGLREPVSVMSGNGCVLGLPSDTFRLSVAVEYETAWSSRQEIDLEVTAKSFAEELAPARTFALEKWIEPLRVHGLIRGGSPDNAIILNDEGPSLSWRMKHELASHKALDVVGDVALLFAADGGILSAHIIAIKAGHELHRQWMQECLQRGALTKNT